MSTITLTENETMDRVTTEALVENLKDLWDAQRGMIPLGNIRRLEVTNALVDTGATTLVLPTRLIRQLGLNKTRDKTVISANGSGVIGIYEAVRLTIQGRDCVVEVMEVPDEIPALIGQIPLEMLDFVVDPQGRRLIGNPAHGGEQILELL
ncbi:MAG: retroviral-like aspartic protease [Planctomycetaceae bacterium]|nr:retroviral-like aspartic protease [Planctomycetaceae bacterium]